MFSVSVTWFKRDTILVTLDFRVNDLSHTFWSWEDGSVYYFVEAAQKFHYGKDATTIKS
jgi:hypothetical protein